jgi:hypothetical protein
LIADAATFSLQDPIFDWMSHKDAEATRDRRLQEAIGYYDPIKHGVIFVFLPSASGNSAAVWREKVEVPGDARKTYRREIRASPKAAFKNRITVDEHTCAFHASLRCSLLINVCLA